jgi:C-terminal processing protease CtpA/Prc
MKKELSFTTYTTILFSAIIFIFTANGCKDNNVPPENNIPDSVLLINNFIHDNMDFAYFWNEQMPDLDPAREPDPKKYFYKLLFSSIDRWSFITDDYQSLKDYFAGIRKSVGYSYRLYRVSINSNDVVGFIEYVNPDTPADNAGLKRGDMFFKINGTQITTENYMELIGLDDFTLTLGDLNDDNTITPIGAEISLTAEVLTIDPILLDTVIEHAGQKIGYLVYNSFVADYDEELKSVFGKFKSEGVNGLVLDLRYNSGGSVNTAILMASMIAPAADTGKVLIRNTYNKNITDYFEEKYPDDESIFIDRLIGTENNLNLNKYVALTSYKTASASEMVIYTLEPYMEDIIQIGEQTHGKYFGSITLSDPDQKHNWAIQPIVMRAENADGSIDYNQGLLPDIELDERYEYPLGDKREAFLSQALYELTGEWPEGAASASLKTKQKPRMLPEYIEEGQNTNLKYMMYKNKTPAISLP